MRKLKRWLKSTSKRTFVLYPMAVILIELAVRRGALAFNPFGLPLLAWGYLEYRLAGVYRTRRGGGGPGIEVPPDRIVASGPYRYTRNPMYLGHLIFMLGLTITFASWFAAALLLAHAIWFHLRVVKDEERLERRFGEDYRAYRARVKRWIPGLL
jgi:protein-S-isoprenylcysteine O-methyltransferase Ste14